MNNYIAVALVVGIGLWVAVALLLRQRRHQIVYDYQAGLHYRDGKFLGVLSAGRYAYRQGREQIEIVDLRSASGGGQSGNSHQ